MNLKGYKLTLDPLRNRSPVGSSPPQHLSTLRLKARADKRNHPVIGKPGE